MLLYLCVHQRAQEEVHSKELKVKLLTDSVNSFIGKAPPTAHDALRSELDVLTANYQRLCSRLDGKCKTLEVQYFMSSSVFFGQTKYFFRKYLRCGTTKILQTLSEKLSFSEKIFALLCCRRYYINQFI